MEIPPREIHCLTTWEFVKVMKLKYQITRDYKNIQFLTSDPQGIMATIWLVLELINRQTFVCLVLFPSPYQVQHIKRAYRYVLRYDQGNKSLLIYNPICPNLVANKQLLNLITSLVTFLFTLGDATLWRLWSCDCECHIVLGHRCDLLRFSPFLPFPSGLPLLPHSSVVPLPVSATGCWVSDVC